MMDAFSEALLGSTWLDILKAKLSQRRFDIGDNIWRYWDSFRKDVKTWPAENRLTPEEQSMQFLNSMPTAIQVASRRRYQAMVKTEVQPDRYQCALEAVRTELDKLGHATASARFSDAQLRREVEAVVSNRDKTAEQGKRRRAMGGQDQVESDTDYEDERWNLQDEQILAFADTDEARKTPQCLYCKNKGRANFTHPPSICFDATNPLTEIPSELLTGYKDMPCGKIRCRVGTGNPIHDAALQTAGADPAKFNAIISNCAHRVNKLQPGLIVDGKIPACGCRAKDAVKHDRANFGECKAQKALITAMRVAGRERAMASNNVEGAHHRNELTVQEAEYYREEWNKEEEARKEAQQEM